jgi:hypothetical protein
MSKTPMNTHERRRAGLSAMLLAAVLVAFTVWQATRLDDAVEAMPPSERRALYERTRDSLATTCRAPAEALVPFCREQAELVLRFPECDRTCRTLAARHTRR